MIINTGSCAGGFDDVPTGQIGPSHKGSPMWSGLTDEGLVPSRKLVWLGLTAISPTGRASDSKDALKAAQATQKEIQKEIKASARLGLM